jgi:hypothetical protein
MRAKLNTREKHDIALGVALLYTRNADAVMKMWADYAYPVFNHVELTVEYTRELVWVMAVQKLGEARADRLSGSQVESLVKEAMAEFRLLVAIDYCHPRGFTRVFGGQK